MFGEENMASGNCGYNCDGILDLVDIKTSNTGTNSAEVHVAVGPYYS
jgi:hypothetical protein